MTQKSLSSILCTKCHLPKSFGEFHSRVQNANGVRQPCKLCTSIAGAEYRKRPGSIIRKREVANAYYRRPDVHSRVLARSRIRRRRDHLKYKFGVTPEQVQQMIASQNNRCAICGLSFIVTPNIDHDHKSGQVRGLLCSNCNHGLGQFKDDVSRLEAAIAYLKLFVPIPISEKDTT